MRQSEGHDIAHPDHVPAVGQRTCPSLSRVAVPPGVWQQGVSQLHLYTAEHAAVSQLDRAHRHAVATQEPPPKAPGLPVLNCLLQRTLHLLGPPRAAQGAGDPLIRPESEKER